MAKTINAQMAAEMDHCMDLLTAEAEGRMLVLPFKVGDRIFAVDCGKRVHAAIVDRFLYDGNYIGVIYHYNHFGFVEGTGIFGKTVFLAHEEAEAAMKGRGNND